MAAYSYEFRIPGLCKAPAQAVGEMFEALQSSPDGLSPSSVLNASREEGTLLHDSFEWDDAVAGEKYRLSQARSFIQNLTIVERSDDQTERSKGTDRAFVITPGYKSAYVTLNSALSNGEWRSHLLGEAKREMEMFCAKYQRLSELADIVQRMNKKIKSM